MEDKELTEPTAEEAAPLVYGARCTWWDSKDKAAGKGDELPRCPNCGGVLFETPEATWFYQVVSRL